MLDIFLFFNLIIFHLKFLKCIQIFWFGAHYSLYSPNLFYWFIRLIWFLVNYIRRTHAKSLLIYTLLNFYLGLISDYQRIAHRKKKIGWKRHAYRNRFNEIRRLTRKTVYEINLIRIDTSDCWLDRISVFFPPSACNLYFNLKLYFYSPSSGFSKKKIKTLNSIRVHNNWD